MGGSYHIIWREKEENKLKLKLWLGQFIQEHCHTLTWIPEILFMLRELKNNDGKLGVVGKGIAETVLI